MNDLITHCDRCGKELKVMKEIQDRKVFYIVHGLFCINIPSFFCGKECFKETMANAKGFDYLDRDDKGRPVVDVEVMINESLLLDKMYDIVYEAENPLFPTLVLQRLLAVDPENTRFLYALSSLYVGILSTKKTTKKLKEKINERLTEIELELKRLSPAGYEKLKQMKEYYLKKPKGKD